MKKLIVATVVSVFAIGVAFAQDPLPASFTFTNTGVADAGVSDPDGNSLGFAEGGSVTEGPYPYHAVAMVQTETDGEYTQEGLPAPFIVNGLFSRQFLDPASNLIELDGVAGGTVINVIVRAWDTRTGDDYDSATIRGESDPVEVTTGNDTSGGAPTLPPLRLDGLQAFSLVVVPEPSTIALGLLGAGLLLFRRRK